jgi:hypothetical protein
MRADGIAARAVARVAPWVAAKVAASGLLVALPGILQAGEALCGAQLPSAHRLVAVGQGDAVGRSVAFVPEPAPWAVSRHFALRGELCGAGRLLRVDADMPAHRHGMNYRPTLSLQPDGSFVAQGLLLHMPGRWRIRFEIETDGRRHWLEQTVDLK